MTPVTPAPAPLERGRSHGHTDLLGNLGNGVQPGPGGRGGGEGGRLSPARLTPQPCTAVGAVSPAGRWLQVCPPFCEIPCFPTRGPPGAQQAGASVAALGTWGSLLPLRVIHRWALFSAHGLLAPRHPVGHPDRCPRLSQLLPPSCCHLLRVAASALLTVVSLLEPELRPTPRPQDSLGSLVRAGRLSCSPGYNGLLHFSVISRGWEMRVFVRKCLDHPDSTSSCPWMLASQA